MAVVIDSISNRQTYMTTTVQYVFVHVIIVIVLHILSINYPDIIDSSCALLSEYVQNL